MCKTYKSFHSSSGFMQDDKTGPVKCSGQPPSIYESHPLDGRWLN
ncbi:hypothetical protein [Evansella clarkii]|nr:hypothetical protein [Evansella clarkii]